MEVNKARVAVVTLNWNGAGFLRECVESILASHYDLCKIIVVDNHSSDDSIQIMKSNFGSNSLVHLIINEQNLGYSRGMNIGLRYAFQDMNADYCLVMNNDTVLDPDAIEALVQRATQFKQVGFVTGKVYYFGNPDTLQTVGKISHPLLINGGHIGRGEIDKGQYDKDRELAFCDDIFWLVTREVYEKTGAYDPEFFVQAEDFDWQLRAKKAGFKILFAHKAKLWHRESMVLGKMSPKKAYYDARNPLIAVMKNCDLLTGRNYLRYKLRHILLPSIGRLFFRAKFKLALATCRGVISALLWRCFYLRNMNR